MVVTGSHQSLYPPSFTFFHIAPHSLFILTPTPLTESSVMENEMREMGKVREMGKEVRVEGRVESQVGVEGSEQGIVCYTGVMVIIILCTKCWGI